MVQIFFVHFSSARLKRFSPVLFISSGSPAGRVGGRMALGGLVKLPSEDLRIHSGRLDKKVSDEGTVRIDKLQYNGISAWFSLLND
jgi:hypothetical protein